MASKERIFSPRMTLHRVSLTTRSSENLGTLDIRLGRSLSPNLVWGKPGESVLLSRTAEGLTNIWEYHLDERTLERVTFGPGPDSSPMSAPNGDGVYFVSGRRSGALMVYDTRSGVTRELVSGTTSVPNLSRDGNRVMYARQVEPGRIEEIWLADLDGSNQRKLFSAAVLTPGYWSPDTSRVMLWDDSTGESQGFIVSADGREQIRLAHVSGQMINVDWAHDGRSVYVQSDFESKPVLWRLPTDGSSPEKLTDSCLVLRRATPDSRYLVGTCAMPQRSTGICLYSLVEKTCSELLPNVTNGALNVTRDGEALLYVDPGRGEMVFHKVPWKDGKLTGEPEVALQVPFTFPIWLGYFGSAFDYTPDLSTIVYARPAGQADLYFLGPKN